jgi:hypothetical protein
MVSQKVRLVEEVARLCNALGRPVSSRDLAKVWASDPERRPLLLQRPGQLLIKATRPCESSPSIRRVGLIGNLAFYAANSDPKWDRAFHLHSIHLRMKQHVKWGVPQQALYLLGTEHECVARNALSGFMAEWDACMDDADVLAIAVKTGFVKMLELARNQNPTPFAGKCPPLSIPVAAEKIIRAACAAYREDESIRLNVNRHLARLSWPKVSFFTRGGFWLRQVRAYCHAQWPLGDGDPIEQRALSICMFYGLAKT